MSASWQRWLKYAKAKLDASLRESEADLDRREAQLQAEAEGKPWLSSTGEAPTFEEARARIEHQAREAGEQRRREGPSTSPTPARPGPALEGGPDGGAPAATPPSTAPAPGGPPEATIGDPLASFDMAAHEKAADERLAAIRRELGLGDEPDPPDPAAPPESPADPPPRDPPPDRSADDEPDDDTPVAPV